MQRLRTTFKRSRTPTGAEMKTQSSLEVPKQVRSVSFDEIQFETKRLQSDDTIMMLKVPQLQDQQKRSHSIDACGGPGEESSTFLEVPTRGHFQRRRSSSSKPTVCVHCQCLEEHVKMQLQSAEDQLDRKSQLSLSMSESSCSEDEVVAEPCTIKVTLTPTALSPPSHASPPTLVSPVVSGGEDPFVEFVPSPSTPTRRKSIHRQEAFFAEPSGSSLENMSEACSDGTSEGAVSEGDFANTMQGLVVSDIYLKVPDLKRDRAASVDSCFSKVSQGKTEELQHSNISLEVPVGSNVALRSRSVDIVLPTDEQARYKALTMAASGGMSGTCDKDREINSAGERTIRSTPDWSDSAINGDHLWVHTSVSGDFCYTGDADCTKHGPRMKCSACNVVAHQNCMGILLNKMRFTCKPTFRDVGVRQYREQTSVQHHWVHRRSEKGKCRQCGKSFQSKLSFSSKEIVAISCSWCKLAFHNKECCFNVQRISEECNLGVHKCIIVPPSWIVKLPRKGSFKSSLRKTPKKRASGKKRTSDKDKEHRSFAIKPIPLANLTPLIVFINPKSGGNQGAKLLQKFQWLLNPRQVFDLTQGGPKMGLEMFKKVPNLRILACGGDGTAGWVLSVIDQIGISPPPAVAVLPLGTGNDLARALGWGGGYTDEPISKILTNISASESVLLDRWSLNIEKNTNVDIQDGGKENLPLNVVNNYYSLGVDAHIALEFHEAREAHPEKFNSRLRNKMFYGQMGGKDLLKRKWKGLADFVTLECDGKDLTPKLKELKVHAIVFLNICSYGGGTRPWNKSMGTSEPSTEDGLIEVVGLTTYQLPLLQAGGHGTCITQCKTAKIVTFKTIPMQVDGEACRLAPSVINLSLLNQAPMLSKRKYGKPSARQAALDNLKVSLQKISMADYEQHHYDKELLVQAAVLFGVIEVNPVSDLEQVRSLVDKYIESCSDQSLSPEWCFLDCCTAERFFRVDKAQENLHYISDVAINNLYILECGEESPQTPEDKTATPSPSFNHQTSYVIPEMRVSDEGSLDSPSDQPPLSPKVLQFSEEFKFSKETMVPLKEFNDSRQIPSSRTPTPDANINIKRNVTFKPNEDLLKAAKVGDLKTVKELHCQGHSLLAKDVTGQTMLHYACHYGHKDVVKYLLGHAPSSLLNVQDVTLGQTALHKAVNYRWNNICCMLVAGGAALDIADNKGLTPRMVAIQTNNQELATYLQGQENFLLLSSDLGTEV